MCNPSLIARQATEKMLSELNFHQLRELYCYLVERFIPSWEKDRHKLPMGTEDPIYLRQLILDTFESNSGIRVCYKSLKRHSRSFQQGISHLG